MYFGGSPRVINGSLLWQEVDFTGWILSWLGTTVGGWLSWLNPPVVLTWLSLLSLCEVTPITFLMLQVYKPIFKLLVVVSIGIACDHCQVSISNGRQIPLSPCPLPPDCLSVGGTLWCKWLHFFIHKQYWLFMKTFFEKLFETIFFCEILDQTYFWFLMTSFNFINNPIWALRQKVSFDYQCPSELLP